MKYFDVLFTLHNIDNPDDAQYQVKTVKFASQKQAESWGRRQAASLFHSGTGHTFSRRFWRVAPAGEMDAFIGRYVGEFIDEAFVKR